MSRAPLIWAAGAVVSVAIHGAVGAALLWSLQPQPISDQPVPETAMQLVAYQINRTQARETAPYGEAAATGDTQGTSLSQGKIPQSRAQPVAPVSANAEAASTKGDALSALDSTAERSNLVVFPAVNIALKAPATTKAATSDMQAVSISSSTPDAKTASAAALIAVEIPSKSPAATIATAAQPATFALAPQAPATTATASAALKAVEIPSKSPAATTATATQPATFALAPQAPATTAAASTTLTATDVFPASPKVVPASFSVFEKSALASVPTTATASPSVKPTAQSVAQATPVATPVAQAEPDVTRARATLAFLGAGNGPVDPVSLAAFQSFMQPGDASGAAAQVKDGIAGLLSQVPCSRLQVQFQPDTNTLLLTGHVPDEGLKSPVLESLQAQMGADIRVADNMLILPRPQCDALGGIATVGLAQSTDQITNPLLVGDNTHAREFRYTEGQQLILDLTAPDYDAYVYVDYFDAKGQVIHLSPNESVPLILSKAKSALQVGAKTMDDPGLFITIGPPYGQEIAVAFAASVPIHDGLRPIIEPADTYLTWMRDRIAQTRAEYPDFKGEWVYFFVITAQG